jgi:hypothetical protein
MSARRTQQQQQQQQQDIDYSSLVVYSPLLY